VRGDNVVEVWKNAFQTLGKDDALDAKFSREFRKEIMENQEMILSNQTTLARI
jgi:hypothetical protein